MAKILDYCDCAGFPLRSFEAGDVVMEQGTKDGAIYVLKSGSVEVTKRGIEINSTANPGAVFGEIALLLDASHTATVVTQEACEFYVAEDAEGLMRERGEFLHEIARVLARRLVQVSERVVELNDQLDLHDGEAGQFSGVLRGLVDQMG